MNIRRAFHIAAFLGFLFLMDIGVLVMKLFDWTLLKRKQVSVVVGILAITAIVILWIVLTR
jgi:hypothetical protein